MKICWWLWETSISGDDQILAPFYILLLLVEYGESTIKYRTLWYSIVNFPWQCSMTGDTDCTFAWCTCRHWLRLRWWLGGLVDFVYAQVYGVIDWESACFVVMLALFFGINLNSWCTRFVLVFNLWYFALYDECLDVWRNGWTTITDETKNYHIGAKWSRFLLKNPTLLAICIYMLCFLSICWMHFYLFEAANGKTLP